MTLVRHRATLLAIVLIAMVAAGIVPVTLLLQGPLAMVLLLVVLLVAIFAVIMPALRPQR